MSVQAKQLSQAESRLLWIAIAGLFGALHFYSVESVATLGGDAASVGRGMGEVRSGTNIRKPVAEQKTIANNQYTVQEYLSDGIKVREYISAEGKVFAVSWRGVAKPDLNSLLGAYFTEFNSEEKSRPPSRTRHVPDLQTPNIVVHKSGHMRDIRGTTYVRDLVPVGVDVGELK